MEGSLEDAVLRSVESRGDSITESDEGLVSLAARYARQIDAGLESGGQEATKALYLGPHLVKALEVLGCSPSGRGEVGSSNGKSGPRDNGGSDELTVLRAKRAKRGGA